MTGNRQNGAALLMTLLILFVLTLLAASNMERVTMQEMMVNAQRDGDLALELTEEVLREAERRIGSGLVVLSDFDDKGPLYSPGTAPVDIASAEWTEDNSFAATETFDAWSASFSGPQIPVPRYFIELIGDVEGTSQVTDVVMQGRVDATTGDIRPTGFRIVAMSQGLSGSTRRIVEVYYAGEL
ncbi:pilus assembly PilX family protein [Marinobacter mobilis]|uniref:PilX N-terminal n=1 Tax=Marinobacter mobilis TaxID=488533 RepID=A0A1H3B5R0_9GAMM|nr:PilX N-terminal domain-containing pilus assembly protein [Marinobacter mobilis]SDX37272.1 PilX N-terminal [Marinobacter mobilis]